MQFIPNGPSIPDELLVARDAGDVIFFCGAGISQHEAGLPNFERLGRDVIDILGAAQDSPARSLLTKALEMGRMAGVGGLLATDRVFGLLEREFEVADVLGDDAQQWPYRIEDVLARLGEDPVVGSDPRLAELRRRRQR